MSSRGRWLVIVIPAAIVGALLLRNVLADDAAVLALARDRACEGRPGSCSPRMSQLIKTPLFHEIRYTVGGKQRDVRCRRSLYVIGDYACLVVPDAASAR